MKHLQGIADLGNEAGLLRRELSAVRAELRNALEANKDLRDRLLARELGGEKDIREAYRIAVERIKRLEDDNSRLLSLLAEGHLCASKDDLPRCKKTCANSDVLKGGACRSERVLKALEGKP